MVSFEVPASNFQHPVMDHLEMIVRQMMEIIGKVGEDYFSAVRDSGNLGAAAAPTAEAQYRNQGSGVSLPAPLKRGAGVLGKSVRRDLRRDWWGLGG